MTQPEELRAIAKEIRTISKDTYHPAVTNSREYTLRLGNCANRLDVIAGPETNPAAPVYQPAPYYEAAGTTGYRGVQRRVAWRPINFPDRRVHSDTHVDSRYPTYNGPQRRTSSHPINFADRRVHGNAGAPTNLVGYSGLERRRASNPINFADRRVHGVSEFDRQERARVPQSSGGMTFPQQKNRA